MRQVCYSVAMSLDGFIAGARGEFDWIVPDPEVDFAAMFARFDTLVMGRKTSEAAQAQGGSGMMGGPRCVVVSRTLRPEDHPGVTVVGEGLGEAIDRLRAAPGKDIRLFGGGGLFRSLLDLGRVDRVEVAVVPVLLGEGIPLLAPGSGRARLRLLGSRTLAATGTVALEYAVEPRTA
jgi:dihydrofolate reductase